MSQSCLLWASNTSPALSTTSLLALNLLVAPTLHFELEEGKLKKLSIYWPILVRMLVSTTFSVSSFPYYSFFGYSVSRISYQSLRLNMNFLISKIKFCSVITVQDDVVRQFFDEVYYQVIPLMTDFNWNLYLSTEMKILAINIPSW